MNFKNHFFTITCIILLSSCQKDNNVKITNNMEKVTPNEWNQLSKKRIYFGHQSVGFNIVDGIEMHMTENHDLQLHIERGNELKLFDNPVFAHSPNGKNGDPKSKINDFYQKMEEGLGNKVDIAGFKFCYVDFSTETDISDVFSHYKNKMNELTLKYPTVKFVHFTAPLMSLQKGPKGFVKKLLGKDIGVEDNYAREKFNNLLRQEYGHESIFDLAMYESLFSNGERNYTLENDEKVYSMVPAYTNDGGHLSKTGKYFISGELLLFLKERD